MDNNQPIDEPKPFLVYIVRLIFLVISKIFWRIKFSNTENIPHNLPGGLLVVSNHPSYFDPFWISLPIKRDLRYMAWDQAFNWFFVGYLIKNLGAYPVNTNFGSRKSFNQTIELLKSGKTVMIFPEAVREFSDGKILPFKIGAAKIALLADVPILPVTVCGANKVWAREMKFPRPAKVEIIFHPVLKTNKSEETVSAEKLTQKIKLVIESGKLLK